jgi:hypothetical protein
MCGKDYKALFIVGRRRLTLDEIYTIRPEDIESTKVIKDKEGICRYTNGDYDSVVIITLKDGKKFSNRKNYKYN